MFSILHISGLLVKLWNYLHGWPVVKWIPIFYMLDSWDLWFIYKSRHTCQTTKKCTAFKIFMPQFIAKTILKSLMLVNSFLLKYPLHYKVHSVFAQLFAFQTFEVGVPYRYIMYIVPICIYTKQKWCNSYF